MCLSYSVVHNVVVVPNGVPTRLTACLPEHSWFHSPLNPFTQTSGVTKALAVTQTKGGTVWQDLSFCYINVNAREVSLV